MPDAAPTDRLIAQLRSNLRAATIPFTEADIEGIVAKGFLSRIEAFERLMDGMPAHHLPDHLTAPLSVVADEPKLVPPQIADAAPLTTVAGLAPQIRVGQVSPVELTEKALARLTERDQQLNAFQLVLVAQARAAAQQAEQEIAAGTYLGPLHGIPVAVKDLLDLEGTPTTAGGAILGGTDAEHDATTVARLRAAGAIIIGKTRMSEFAYSPGSNNGHYGPTRNPWNADHDSGGSSSGSAAAVADGIVFAALGSDTGGSIRIPAALCGIVGFKPTFGRVSLSGAVPLAWSLDHLGPLARSVADAAIVLHVICGYDPHDARTPQLAPAALPVDLDAGVAGMRVGVLSDDGSGQALATDEALAAWRSGLDALAAAGSELVPLDLDLSAMRVVQGAILAIEAAAYHRSMLRERLDDYGAFMRQRVLAAFAYDGGAYLQAQQMRQILRQRFNAVFEQVELLSTPSQPDVAPALGTPASTAFTGPFNTLGWPAISVPVGVSTNNLPFGMQIVAKPWDEAVVLQAAQVVERAQGQFVPPSP